MVSAQTPLREVEPAPESDSRNAEHQTTAKELKPLPIHEHLSHHRHGSATVRLIKQTSRFITTGVVTLSIVTIACALVSRQFRIMQERAYATRLEALRMTIHKAQGLTLDSAYLDNRAAREPGHPLRIRL